MAENVAGGVTYYLAVDNAMKDSLTYIRHWQNLKLGNEDNTIWVKGFDDNQVNSIPVKSLPAKTIYYEKAGKLFLLNSLLPERNVPAVLWTPIDRALSVTLPSFNHNYFGVIEKIKFALVPQHTEAAAVAMITDINTLRAYVEDAPGIRLERIRWCIFNFNQALLLGWPLLPIPGIAFWERNNMLLPAGFDFEFAVLEEVISKSINPDGAHLILWNTDSSYCAVAKNDVQPLSRSSFRMSYNQLSGVTS